MRWLLNVIGTPEQAHRATSPEHYRRIALVILRKYNPHDVANIKLADRPERPGAYVSSGRWVVDCLVCGNGPSAHPTWELAICCECGAVYVPTFPTNWQQVERVLLAREQPTQRHYFPHDTVAATRGLRRPETLGDLIRENAERGLPIEAEAR